MKKSKFKIDLNQIYVATKEAIREDYIETGFRTIQVVAYDDSFLTEIDVVVIPYNLKTNKRKGHAFTVTDEYALTHHYTLHTAGTLKSIRNKHKL